MKVIYPFYGLALIPFDFYILDKQFNVILDNNLRSKSSPFLQLVC